MQQIWLRSLGQEGPLEKGRSAAASAAKSLQPCLTLGNLVDCSLPSSSVCGILQPRVLEWVDLPFRRRQWQPTPVFLPGKSHGRGNLVGCSPWGH